MFASAKGIGISIPAAGVYTLALTRANTPQQPRPRPNPSAKLCPCGPLSGPGRRPEPYHGVSVSPRRLADRLCRAHHASTNAAGLSSGGREWRSGGGLPASSCCMRRSQSHHRGHFELAQVFRLDKSESQVHDYRDPDNPWGRRRACFEFGGVLGRRHVIVMIMPMGRRPITSTETIMSHEWVHMPVLLAVMPTVSA